MIKGGVSQVPVFKVVNSRQQTVNSAGSLITAKRLADWKTEQSRRTSNGELTFFGKPQEADRYSVKPAIGYKVPGGYVKGVYLKPVIVEDRAEAVRLTNQRKFLSRF